MVGGGGVAADQGYLGPWVLTSALKRVDTAVFDSIKDAVDGHFKGGQDAVYGLDQDGVGIGKFSPQAPAGIADKVAKVRADIVSGKIKNIPTVVK
jgi:basic membrane protein A